MRLKHKIALFVVGLVTVLIASISVQSARGEIKRTEEAMTGYAKMMAKVVAVRWLSDIIDGREVEMGDLDRFASVVMSFDERIACIAVSSRGGRVVAGDINKKWVEYEASKNEALAGLLQSDISLRGFKAVSVELASEGKTFGGIKIIFSLSAVREQAAKSVVSWIALGSGFILVGIGGAFLIAGRVTGPISRVMNAMRQVEQGDLEQKVRMESTDEVGQMAGAFNKMVEGLREREFVKDTFSRYVSKQVADRILREKDFLKLMGEKRVVTVLFADIRGFTPLAETLPPEKVIDILNTYFSIMIEVVFKFGGVLNKFIGDAIMVTYNAPLDQKRHELRAILTGLEMQERIAELNADRLQNGEPLINVGIGINTGEAVAGNVGSAARLEYTVIGSDVNLAQRIESRTEKGRVHISENTYRAVKDYVEVVKLDPVAVKGISEPVQLYLVTKARIPEGFYENG